MGDRVAAVRAFNRFYTRTIGVLGEGVQKTRYSLTEARVFFELAHTDAVEVVDLRRALDLDAGYLSRILARFERDGYVVREKSPTDARKQVIRLTAAGRRVFAMLDERSNADMRTLLDRLGEAEQRRLLGAMASIRELLGDAEPHPAYVLRPPLPGDLGWVVQRHGAIYAREYDWDEGFEAMVARIVADYVAGRDPHREAAWIAEVDGRPAGSVFCVRKDDETAQLRLLLVEPEARGMGIGGRLVDECVRYARRAGYRRMILWTNAALADARRLYQRAGFRLTEQEKGRDFGHDQVFQYWEREL
ncbi:bifunctional helix-turn-helix transcriptional regulator/GNAT family N-acetyltransferase [Rhizomonospora bruguierae]|uniref:bifunctional helix-turn-helix transcriptional regulator/GNAT family N-acetyltransferase n=1 Tax=Rhizomonospora bruguierae TaxID=1581705 RepID=UPI001BD037B3|nr:bifunctional helix-turn-helix transcriptional regulator/GNAT family N-acetyltransferase [Micromonospora sp. NBRC 107566]